jgi:hypothetical protein
MTDSKKRDILWATATKFFPAWDVETGLAPDPWAIVKSGTVTLEVHVSRSVTLENFEEEAWYQFKQVREDFELERVTPDE